MFLKLYGFSKANYHAAGDRSKADDMKLCSIWAGTMQQALTTHADAIKRAKDTK